MLGGYKNIGVNAGGNDGGYTTKFLAQSLSVHPDFTAVATWTMDTLPPGVDDITTDTTQTIGSASSQTVSDSTTSYSNITVIYASGTSYNSDVIYYQNSKN